MFGVDEFCSVPAEPVLFLIFHSLISPWTLIKSSIFCKSIMRSLRWIEINSFNRFRFLAEVSTNLQKMHYFGQFKDHNSGRKKTKLDKWHHFFIFFLNSNCLWHSFLYLKIVKIHSHGVLLSFILVCNITEFWRCKLWDQNFVSFD